MILDPDSWYQIPGSISGSTNMSVFELHIFSFRPINLPTQTQTKIIMKIIPGNANGNIWIMMQIESHKPLTFSNVPGDKVYSVSNLNARILNEIFMRNNMPIAQPWNKFITNITSKVSSQIFSVLLNIPGSFSVYKNPSRRRLLSLLMNYYWLLKEFPE